MRRESNQTYVLFVRREGMVCVEIGMHPSLRWDILKQHLPSVDLAESTEGNYL